MKKRKRVTGRKTTKKTPRLQAKASGGKREFAPPSEWAGYYRPVKKPVTLRLDADILAWFRGNGRGYQTRINRALRKVMLNERKKTGE